jgi:putative colanic acid biosysnthesis UDP-glucose lipid carrier transferase
MQATPNILSPHHKVLDFLNRFSDVALLSTSLALAIEFAQEEWKLTATAILLFAIIYHQLAASISNLYESQRSLTVSKQLYRTIAALAGTFALVTMTSALSNRLHAFADREMLFTWFVLSAISFSLWRIILRQVLSQFRQRGINTRHAAIVGASTLGQSLAARFDQNPWMGVQVQSFYDDNASVDHVNNYPVINNF